MKKIVIPILALLLLPVMAGAANDLTFDADTTISLTGTSIDLTIISGSVVDEMVVNTNNVQFTLSSNSYVVVRSADKYQLPGTYDGNTVGYTCGSSYSEVDLYGPVAGTKTFIVTPVATVCTAPVTTSSSGGGGLIIAPAATDAPITSTGEVTATASGGGETTLTVSENVTAKAKLPANAVNASTIVKIANQAKEAIIASKPAPVNRSVVGDYVYNFTATAAGTSVSSFNRTVTLTFTYTDAQISGLNESNLRVFYWKESTLQWVALPTTVNAGTNTVTAQTDHFTYFVIMGLAEGAEDEDLVEEEPETITVADGDLVRNPNAEGMAQFDIYIVKLVGTKKFKRLILSPHVFESYEHFDKNGDGSPWDDVMDVAQSVMDEYTTSDLVRAVGDTKVYKLIATGDTGTKQWLNMTAEQFVSEGYDSDSIYEINTTDRDAYTTGTDIAVEAL